MKHLVKYRKNVSFGDNVKTAAAAVLVMSEILNFSIAEIPYDQAESPWLIVTTIALGVVSFGCMGIIFGDEEKDEYKD